MRASLRARVRVLARQMQSVPQMAARMEISHSLIRSQDIPLRTVPIMTMAVHVKPQIPTPCSTVTLRQPDYLKVQKDFPWPLQSLKKKAPGYPHIANMHTFEKSAYKTYVPAADAVVVFLGVEFECFGALYGPRYRMILVQASRNMFRSAPSN